MLEHTIDERLINMQLANSANRVLAIQLCGIMKF